MIIREATMADLDTLIVMGREMTAECVNDVPREVNRDEVLKRLEATLALPEMFLCALAFEGERPLGFITGICGTYGFSTDREIISHLWYARQNCRNSRAGRVLMNHLLAWGYALGAKKCHAGVVSGIHPDRTEKLLYRLGFEFSGKSYAKVL